MQNSNAKELYIGRWASFSRVLETPIVAFLSPIVTFYRPIVAFLFNLCTSSL